MRDFCAGHGCSPGSSGRQWQAGGGHTFEGSPSSPMFSGSLGSVLLRARCNLAMAYAIGRATCFSLGASGRAWLRDLQWISWC